MAQAVLQGVIETRKDIDIVTKKGSENTTALDQEETPTVKKVLAGMTKTTDLDIIVVLTTKKDL